MTPAQVRRLAKRLPTGWLPKAEQLLADAGTPYGRSTISRVKRGQLRNATVLNALLAVCEQHEAAQAELDERLKRA